MHENSNLTFEIVKIAIWFSFMGYVLYCNLKDRKNGKSEHAGH